jgi:hypothetical protein
VQSDAFDGRGKFAGFRIGFPKDKILRGMVPPIIAAK